MLRICGVCQSAIVEVKQDSWEYNSKKSSQVKTIGINYLGDGIESKFKIKQTSLACRKRNKTVNSLILYMERYVYIVHSYRIYVNSL